MAAPLTASGQGTERAGESRGQDTVIPVAFHDTGKGFYGEADKLRPLSARDWHDSGPGLVAFSSKDDGRDAGALAPTLRSMNYDESHINGGGQVAVAGFKRHASSTARSMGELEDGSPPITDKQPEVYGSFGVRRLMPVECERLQGFPDGWTESGYVHPSKEYIDECARKGEVPPEYVIQRMSDSARYRQLGNAVCVAVTAWLGRRIVEVEGIA